MQYKKANKTALVCAVDMLAVRSYSKSMLSDRLQRKGFGEAEIAAAIQQLSDRGYLDDTALCVYMYRRLMEEKKYSIKQIKYKLLQKGFDEALISDCYQTSDLDLEKEAALRVLRSKFRVHGQAEPMLMMRYLYQKGFARQAIDWAVGALNIEDDMSESQYM